MYYVMSVPEILVLMFVLFLWVLSIVWFFKRYEKISTIERADLGHHRANLDTKQDLTGNQNSSLDEIVTGNDENNNEEDEGSTSLLRNDEDDDDDDEEEELGEDANINNNDDDESSSILNFHAKSESLKNLTTTTTNNSANHYTNKSTTNNNTFSSSSANPARHSGMLLKVGDFTSGNLLTSTNNNLSVYGGGGVSSACTSATTSIANFKDSIFNMFNSFNSGTNLIRRTNYLDIDEQTRESQKNAHGFATTATVNEKSAANAKLYVKNKTIRSNSEQQQVGNMYKHVKLEQRAQSNKVCERFQFGPMLQINRNSPIEPSSVRLLILTRNML